MKTDLFYYTGTGNSLWTARMLAKEMGGAEIMKKTPHYKRYHHPEITLRDMLTVM